MVKDANYAKLGSPKIGTSFEINDHRAVVVALAQAALALLQELKAEPRKETLTMPI